jgi:hypothetical protein
MIALSTQELMRLVVLAAANLLLFKGVGFILIYAPVALVAMVVNLGLFGTFVRPRSMNRGLLAAMLGGLASTIAALAYLADSGFRPRMALAILDAMPRPVFDSLPASVRSASGIGLLEFVLTDCIGISAMLLCGWLAWPRRPSGLDAGAVTHSWVEAGPPQDDSKVIKSGRP